MTAGHVPAPVPPMLAALTDAPFHRPGWVYEEKYDGIRMLAEKEDSRVRLLSRNLRDRTSDFPEIAAAIAALPAPTIVLDGEVVVFEASRVSRFQLLQRREDRPAVPVYVLFDCLFSRGQDLRRQPLAERRRVLESEVPEKPPLQLARRLADDGLEAFEKARRLRLEGLVAKRLASVYRPGWRSPDWLKVKVRNEDEFVIGGFTRPEGSRQHFGALLVGAWDRGKFRYAGKVGTGFTGDTLTSLMKQFGPLVRATSPFHDLPRERNVTWLEPRLVVQIAYTEVTDDGRLRHPVFLGLREDKAASKVRWPRASNISPGGA